MLWPPTHTFFGPVAPITDVLCAEAPAHTDSSASSSAAYQHDGARCRGYSRCPQCGVAGESLRSVQWVCVDSTPIAGTEIARAVVVQAKIKTAVEVHASRSAVASIQSQVACHKY